MQDEYADNNNAIGMWLKSIFGLPYLDPCEVSDAFAFDIMPDAALDERVTQFANYMVETYIADEARFPPSMWATSPSNEADVPRTTNAAEAFHMHFKKRFNSPHPNLYTIAFKLLEYQEIIYIKLQSLQERRTTSAAQQTKAQFIQDMCNQYMYFYLTRQQYVKLVAYKLLPVAQTSGADAESDNQLRLFGATLHDLR